MSTINLTTPACESGQVITPFTFYIKNWSAEPKFNADIFYQYENKDKVEVKEFITKFVAEILPEFDLIYSYEDHENGKLSTYKTVYHLNHNGEYTVIGISSYTALHTYFSIFSSGPSTVETLKERINSKSSDLKKEKTEAESYINFICRNQDGFYTHEFEISDGIDFTSIFDNYEDEFKTKFSDIVLSKLSDDNYNKGIVLLHGAPGTGKTTYLRYLLSKVKKTVMYLPPEMGHSLSDPSFITFLMGNPNSILCIEDAENIIKTREAGGNQAVSNILNITDGILGSALKYQVICTFNANFTEIDSALTRKGRMIGEYEFKALSESKTKSLVEKLYGEGTRPISKEMTLAEIHSMKEDMPVTEKQERKMGFI